MAVHNLEIRELPFSHLTDFSLANLFQTSSSRINEILQNSGISNLIRHSYSSTDTQPHIDAPRQYYSDESFISLTSKNSCNVSAFHQNIRSLSRHVGSLWSYMQSLNFKFDVILLSEIGQKNYQVASHVFNDYNCFYQPPSTNPRGGVAVFIKSNIPNVVIRNDLELKPECTCKKSKVYL